MLQKFISIWLMLVMFFSTGTISSSASRVTSVYEYGAFYQSDGYKLKPISPVHSTPADSYTLNPLNQPYYTQPDFFLKFNLKPDADHIEKYTQSINRRLKTYGRFNRETNQWPYILFGNYNIMPRVAGYDRHHIVSKSSIKNAEENLIYITQYYAPSILLRKDLHTQTVSYGNCKEARVFRANERQALEEENFFSAYVTGLEDVKKIIKHEHLVYCEVNEVEQSSCYVRTRESDISEIIHNSAIDVTSLKKEYSLFLAEGNTSEESNQEENILNDEFLKQLQNNKPK